MLLSVSEEGGREDGVGGWDGMGWERRGYGGRTHKWMG